MCLSIKNKIIESKNKNKLNSISGEILPKRSIEFFILQNVSQYKMLNASTTPVIT